MVTEKTTNLFENKGLIELEKAWKENYNTDTSVLFELAKENFTSKNHAVSLFLADKIIRERNPEPLMLNELRFIRAEGYYEFKFYRQAYPDYVYYLKTTGKNGVDVSQKMSQCKRMIHTGNIGSILFIAVTVLSLDIMYWALYQLENSFPMGISLDWILYTGIAGLLMLVFGLFYRYVIIPRIK